MKKVLFYYIVVFFMVTVSCKNSGENQCSDLQDSLDNMKLKIELLNNDNEQQQQYLKEYNSTSDSIKMYEDSLNILKQKIIKNDLKNSEDIYQTYIDQINKFLSKNKSLKNVIDTLSKNGKPKLETILSFMVREIAEKDSMILVLEAEKILLKKDKEEYKRKWEDEENAKKDALIIIAENKQVIYKQDSTIESSSKFIISDLSKFKVQFVKDKKENKPTDDCPIFRKNLYSVNFYFQLSKNTKNCEGKQYIYLQIIKETSDDFFILFNNEQNYFQSIPYTVKKEIVFTGDNLDISFEWIVGESNIEKGNYQVILIFDDKSKIVLGQIDFKFR